jgi:MFS family permease
MIDNRSSRILGFGAVAFGTLVGPLDSAVNIAFPSIIAAFGMPQSAIQWVIVCYVILYATFLLIFGRLGDLIGHMLVFRAGLAICALAFIGSGMAQWFEWLLVTRALQGVGTAMVLSCGPALTTSLFSDSERTRALGAYAAIIGVGTAIGPSLGGLLVEIWGWTAVFWFRMPIAVIALVLSFGIRMPEQVRADGRFDLVGAALLAFGLGALLVSISRARYGNILGFEFAVYGAIMLATIFLLAWRYRNGATGHAVVQFSMFRNLDLSLVTVTGIMVNLVGFAVMLFVPFYLARLSPLPVALNGLILAVSPAGMIIAGQAGSWLVTRFGAKPMALLGALLVSAGTAAIGFWGPRETVTVLVAASLVHGLGLGLYQVAQLDVSVAALPRANRGVAGSLVMLTRTLGVIVAASLLTAGFVWLETTAVAGAPEDAFLSAFQLTFRYAAAGLAAYLALTCLRPRTWFSSGPKSVS